MVKKVKLGLGLLINLFVISSMCWAAKETPPEADKTGKHQEAAKDLNGPGSAASVGLPQATGPSSASDTKGPTASTQALASKEGSNLPEATPTAATTGGLNDSELEKKVTDILNKNPQIIVTALQKFTEAQEREQQAKMEASLMKYKEEISKESSAALLGKKDAEVKLVVFLDPNCPHCRPFSQALQKVGNNFPDVAILVRHWAILGKDSEEVIRGLWAIKQQGQDQFNAACKAIASSEEKYTYPKLLAWVKDHNLNVEKFKEDSQSTIAKDLIEETSKLAKDIGLQGTPTSLLVDKNGIRLVMPTDEKSLENILKEASTPSKA